MVQNFLRPRHLSSLLKTSANMAKANNGMKEFTNVSKKDSVLPNIINAVINRKKTEKIVSGTKVIKFV